MHRTIAPAAAALSTVALGAAATTASADAEGPLHNYGMCVVEEAMSGDTPLRDFTQFFDPLIDVRYEIHIPHGGQGIPHGCRVPGS